MGLGRTQFGDETKSNGVESVYLQPETRNSTEHSDSIFVPSNQSAPPNSRSSHDRLWNGRDDNVKHQKRRHWWDVGIGSNMTGSSSAV